MCYDFHDIDIPKRPTEYALPLDTEVYFTYTKRPAGLQFRILAAGKERPYAGRGRIGLGSDFAKLPELSILDPFLENRNFVPARYFKIFFRVQLPKLRQSGLAVHCDLQLSDLPAVRITIQRMKEEGAVYDILWRVRPELLQEAPEFTDYIIAGHVLYRGNLRQLRDIPRQTDGAYTADAQELAFFKKLYDTAPYFFDIQDPLFLKREEAAADPLVEGILAGVKPGRKTREWGGPAILFTHVSTQNRSGTSRFVHFVIEAKRLVAAPAKEAAFVPFVCYWPTYSNMSREQRAWYFYWREAFYNGKILKTDLSYIFVAVYEIINRAQPVGEESLERLLRLWEAYREAFPRLDYYMSQWCADYALTNGIAYDFNEVIKRIPLVTKNMRPFLELYVNEDLKTGLHALPFAVLCEFSEYNIRESRFYKAHADLCNGAVRKALAAIDRSLREAKQMGILEYLAPEPKRELWESFTGAVCGRAAAKRIEVEYIPYSKGAKLRAFLGSVMRYVENSLRKQEHHPGRLRSIQLGDAVKQAIDLALSGKAVETAAAPTLVIDLTRAAALEAESWGNTQRLIDAVGEGDDGLLFPQEYQIEETTREAEPADPEAELPPMPELPEEEPISVDADVWQTLAAELPELGRKVLELLLQGGESAAVTALAQAAFTFPEAIYEEINEKAADILGDILIDTENSEVYEEHREPLAAVL